MTSTHWDLVYGRLPLSRDAVLFGIAVALHLPLLLMQFKGPAKPNANAPTPFEIIERDLAIERVLREGMALPPKLSLVLVKPTPDLKFLIPKTVPLPVLPPGVVHINQGINPVLPPGVLPNGGIKTGSVLPTVPSPTAIPVDGPGILPLPDKGHFLVPANTIEAIGVPGGVSLVGDKPKTIHVPTGMAAQAESGITPPANLTGKIFLAPLPAAEPAAPKNSLKVDKSAGKPIVMPEAPDEEIKLVAPKPRTLTPEERRRELFPIHGALKDRPVIKQEIPEYPEWARKKGIESAVKFRFSVTPEGHVKENIQLLEGSGSGELDELARTALLRWLFEPLPLEKGNLVEDGVIEFKFSIK